MTSTSSPEPGYAPLRVRRIRIALGVAVALGVLAAVFAVAIATGSDEEGAGAYAAMLGVVAAGSVGWPLVTWRLLDAPDRTAKRAVILTGALLIVFAVLTSAFWLGLLYGVLGLTILFLALMSDERPGT